ncbi:Condensin complex subunit 3 [Podosphaera aphanis]|nr:Condensin complex subunit 3 [Podosphaera aphanis]
MPGRLSTSTTRSRTSRGLSSKASVQTLRGLSSKASVQTLNSRASVGSRVSIHFIDVPEESPDNLLRTQISTIFRDAQRNIAGHRKLVASLCKIQENCCYQSELGKKKAIGTENFGEEEFKSEFTRCVIRILPVKKSESVGDRVVHFIGLFIRLANDKDNELEKKNQEAGEAITEMPSTRLVLHLVNAILPLLLAKDKFVRYRSTQLISHIISSLDLIDDDLFQLLRRSLLKRIYDKEAMVRAQAVLGLSRLAANDVVGEAGDSDDEDDGAGLLQKLLDVLQNDPASDVRKTLLNNLPVLPTTLASLLERARDQDSTIRRALYSRLLPALGDFRHLSLSMREKLLRWGLRDRDESVRKATHKLFRERWIGDCAASTTNDKSAVDLDIAASDVSNRPNFDALQELLERIDVVNSGTEDGIALEAMNGFWEGRPDYRDAVIFDDNFWDTLTAESVFMARTFNDFCRKSALENSKYEAIIEEKMPEVTRLALYLQRYFQNLLETMEKNVQHESSDDEDEENTVEQEFIVEQLLYIARTLDYSDEAGRRKMFALLRQYLSIPNLPEGVTKLTVGALSEICTGDHAGEREFCSIVLEAVGDVHDTIVDEPTPEDPEQSFHSARSDAPSEVTDSGADKTVEDQQKVIQEIMINIKCLHIVQCMLENVKGNLKKNPDLVNMLNNLVVPAVRSHEAPVRERGLLCLGLCSLLDKPLAEENLTLFIHFFTKGHAALQIMAIQILTDILSVHGGALLDNNPLLLKVYIKALRSSNKTPEVQAVATVAVAKLLLGCVIPDTSPTTLELLRTLVVIYFDASTAQNESVRQTLSYFLPVYSYSRKENQGRMRQIAADAFHKLFEMQQTIDDDDEAEVETISLTTIGAHLVDWTDPRKCYIPANQMTPSDDMAKKKHVDGDVHLEFARDLLQRLESSISREEKKYLAPLLAKLHISAGSTPSLLCDTYNLVCEAIDNKLVSDTAGRNALLKIHVSLGKIVNSMKDKEDDKESGEDSRCTLSL